MEPRTRTLVFIWVDAFDSLPTYLGLVSAGVAIALGDLLKNMAGWAYIVVRRPFRVGDRIEVETVKGDVVDIRLFRSSGACREIIRRVLAERAPDVEAVAGERIRATARTYQIWVGTLTPTVYLSVEESGVLLTARYLVDARQRRTVHSLIWRGILEAFSAEPTVALAYPTVHNYVVGPIRVASEG